MTTKTLTTTVTATVTTGQAENHKHVVFDPILVGVGTWGTAGGSAVEGYRSAASRRRRTGLFRWAVLAGAPAAGWAVYDWSPGWLPGWSHGHARFVAELCLASAFLAAAIWPRERDADRWLRGAGGEVATSAALEALPDRRWNVFHDLAITGSNANIDHLAVGPTGVWIIDTKTTRAVPRVGLRSIRLGDRRLATDSVCWQAQVVSDRLSVKARPVIALHPAAEFGRPEPRGRAIRRRGVRRRGVRVVLVPDLVRRLRRGRRRLGRGDIEELSEAVLEHFPFASVAARQNGRRH